MGHSWYTASVIYSEWDTVGILPQSYIVNESCLSHTVWHWPITTCCNGTHSVLHDERAWRAVLPLLGRVKCMHLPFYTVPSSCTHVRESCIMSKSYFLHYLGHSEWLTAVVVLSVSYILNDSCWINKWQFRCCFCPTGLSMEVRKGYKNLFYNIWVNLLFWNYNFLYSRFALLHKQWDSP